MATAPPARQPTSIRPSLSQIKSSSYHDAVPVLTAMTPKASSPSPSASASTKTSSSDPNANPTQAARTPAATYAQMRATLREVEASATNPTATTAFNAAHTRALEDLRKAQIALAQAWGRGEEEEEVDGDGEADGVSGDVKKSENGADVSGDRGRAKADGSLAQDTSNGTNTSAAAAAAAAGDRTGSNVLNTSSSLLDPSSSTTGLKSTDNNNNKAPNPSSNTQQPNQANSKEQRTQLETETENDIALARKRRAANDRYFERVRRGVLDVVEKLEGVAGRMREVEAEAGSLWDGTSGSELGSSGMGSERDVRDGGREGVPDD